MANREQDGDEFGEEEYTRMILPTEADHDQSDGSEYYRNVPCEHCGTNVGHIRSDSSIQYVEHRFLCEDCDEPTVIEATPPEEPAE